MQDAHLTETQQSLRPIIRPEHQQRQRQDQQFEGGGKNQLLRRSENWDVGTTESHAETRRQRIHLQLRSGKLHNDKRVGAHGSPHHLRCGGDFAFLEGISRKSMGSVDRTPNTIHICAVQFVHKCGTYTQHAWLKNCISSLCAKKSPVIWCVSCMSHPWLFSHPLSSMSASYSSLIYPTTLREHWVHPAHLQAPSVDKLRHLWREDLQSGGNPRTTTPTLLKGHCGDALALLVGSVLSTVERTENTGLWAAAKVGECSLNSRSYRLATACPTQWESCVGTPQGCRWDRCLYMFLFLFSYFFFSCFAKLRALCEKGRRVEVSWNWVGSFVSLVTQTSRWSELVPLGHEVLEKSQKASSF